jgi:hypothetical protein
MAEIKHRPVPHDHNAFLKKASKRKGFREAYEGLEEEYALARQTLSVCPEICTPQDLMGVSEDA